MQKTGGITLGLAAIALYRASLALLAQAGRMSSGLPDRGVLDVTVELSAA